MRNFIRHEFEKLEKRTIPDVGRFYQTKAKQIYPSVTSITSLQSIQGIMEWRARVGEEEADRISRKASNRGSAVHKLCEQYLLTGQAQPALTDYEMFKSLQPHLDLIDNVHCIEAELYSDHLEAAGTVDCIAEYDGKLCVIDFKTALKPKRQEWISGYFMQAAAYAVMFEERTGISVPRLVIIVGVDDQETQVFEETRNKWVPEFIKLREQYRELKEI